MSADRGRCAVIRTDTIPYPVDHGIDSPTGRVSEDIASLADHGITGLPEEPKIRQGFVRILDLIVIIGVSGVGEGVFVDVVIVVIRIAPLVDAAFHGDSDRCVHLVVDHAVGRQIRIDLIRIFGDVQTFQSIHHHSNRLVFADHLQFDGEELTCTGHTWADMHQLERIGGIGRVSEIGGADPQSFGGLHVLIGVNGRPAQSILLRCDESMLTLHAGFHVEVVKGSNTEPSYGLSVGCGEGKGDEPDDQEEMSFHNHSVQKEILTPKSTLRGLKNR